MALTQIRQAPDACTLAAPALCDRVTDQAVGRAVGRRDGPRRICRGDRPGWLPLVRRTGEWFQEGGGEERVLVV